MPRLHNLPTSPRARRAALWPLAPALTSLAMAVASWPAAAKDEFNPTSIEVTGGPHVG